jgi:hypothetical protein
MELAEVLVSVQGVVFCVSPGWGGQNAVVMLMQ